MDDYVKLLDRAYSVITPRAQQRAEIPKVQVEAMPRKTVVSNFVPIARRLNRDVYLMAKFFQKELGAPGTVEGDSFTLHAERNPKVVEAVYERFIRHYVVCPVCSSIDTELRKEGRIYVMRCLACGASTPVRSI